MYYLLFLAANVYTLYHKDLFTCQALENYMVLDSINKALDYMKRIFIIPYIAVDY